MCECVVDTALRLFLTHCLVFFHHTAPVVVPIDGEQQVAVSPEPYSLTFNVTPTVNSSNITWTHHNGLNSETIDENANTFLSFSPDRLTLTLSLPVSQNEGIYTLTATNGRGSGSGSITLDIKSKNRKSIIIIILMLLLLCIFCCFLFVLSVLPPCKNIDSLVNLMSV